MAKETKSVAKVKFHTTLLQAGKTATGICVPEKLVEQLGAGKKPPVKVTINGYIYRSTIAVMGGAYMVGVSAVVRENAGVKGGDNIDVALELDIAPREVALPQDFKKILDSEPVAKKFFETLSYSNKQRFVLPIDQAKTDETRQRRIYKAIIDLKAGKK